MSPNYRLIPEHSGEDVQEDLADFWTWYALKHSISRKTIDVYTRFNNGGVSDYLNTLDIPIRIDHSRVLAGGDSAGGYLALQSGLTQPKGTIRAILVCYPMTTYLRRKRQSEFMGEPSPPESIIDVGVCSLHLSLYRFEIPMSISCLQIRFNNIN